MKKIRGILLDVDGTLVNSNDAHARAWVKALAERGIEVSFEEVRRLIGMGGDKLLPRVAGIHEDTPAGKAISKRRGEIFQKEYLPFLLPFPGAKELLGHIHSEGLRMVVASSAKEDELKGLLKVCGADAFIEAHTSSDDAEHSKPEPDIVHAALDEIGLPAEQVLLLGDTPYDVEAGRRAGVGVIALRCGGWTDEDLAGALAIYDNPKDLLARYHTSPLAK